MGYQPVLDGIRGVAILSVLAFNLQWPWLPGGFLGVDIFFALSGFLITTLLFEEWQTHGSVSLRHFFRRRALRLLPGLIVVVLFVCGYSILVHPPARMHHTLGQALATLFYVSNWTDALAITHGPLGHAWSLAVEMHFYLIWALTLAFLLRADRKGIGTVMMIAATIAVTSWGWRAWSWSQGTPWLRLYLGTDTRLDGLFIGAIAAVVWYRLRHQEQDRASSARIFGWLVPALSAIAIIGIVVMLFVTPVKSSFTYFAGFPAMASATVILILTGLATPSAMVSKWLCFPPLVWFGRISYSLYLWHLPVAALVGGPRLEALGLPPFPAQCLRALACVAAASVSYYLIERKFLDLKSRLHRVVNVLPEASTSVNAVGR